MPLTANISAIHVSGVIEVWGTLTASGNYTNGVGGDTVNLNRQASGAVAAAVLAANFSGQGETVFSSQAPIQFDVWSAGGQNTYVYTGNLTNTTSPANIQFKVSTSATLGTELATGAYPGAITGDIIQFYAVFKKEQ